MNATVYHEFRGPITLETVPDPSPAPDGAVIQVEATGLCRSDWHGWHGNDPDIRQLPHVPGHEFAGTVVAVGRDVRRALVGGRVTIPFVAGCGNCPECKSGNQQVCDHQFQPGFTGWGSFAEYVAVRYADGNLVLLPEGVSSIAAAALGCRLATAYRAVAAQGAVQPGEWVAIHGCGGVGLSAIMVAHALGARPIAVDVRDEPLALAQSLGAEITLNAANTPDVPAAIRDITGRGADVALDALGSAITFSNSIRSLRKRGRHVQVGILDPRDAISAPVLNRIIGHELVLAGSHGLAAHAYPALLALIADGKLDPQRLVDRVTNLEAAPAALASMDQYHGSGITIFTPNA
ncbi:MAG: zinc-dependent alcohol dehydrogenase family protein [Pirellulales bacterium]